MIHNSLMIFIQLYFSNFTGVILLNRFSGHPRGSDGSLLRHQVWRLQLRRECARCCLLLLLGVCQSLQGVRLCPARTDCLAETHLGGTLRQGAECPACGCCCIPGERWPSGWPFIHFITALRGCIVDNCMPLHHYNVIRIKIIYSINGFDE